MENNWVDYVGYLASVFIIGCFLLKDLKAIRAINFAGCICFVIYGIFAGMLWPVIVPNAILAFVQIYHLFIKKA